MSYQLNTPVAFLIFNRPDTTARVFDRIRAARPPKLLVVADGPRNDKPGEAELCRQTRAIVDCVDWPCEVVTSFSSANLGCRGRISTGLDWVFDTVEEAIILEDDCLPDPTFFQYCEELLSRYRDDDRVMMISGDNFQFSRKRSEYSYYFSRYAHIWGWASWRRAWQKYDVAMKNWPAVRDGNWLQHLLGKRRLVNYWQNVFDKVYSGELNTWDYQWTFACMIHNGLAIMPDRNLISNIGFGSGATHTAQGSLFALLNTEPMDFPMVHPPFIIRDAGADAFTDSIMHTPSYFRRALNKARKMLA